MFTAGVIAALKGIAMTKGGQLAIAGVLGFISSMVV